MVPNSEPVPASQEITLFQTFRSYVEHEDRLTNERINRTLLVHGFLIASFVLLLQSRIGAMAKCLEDKASCTDAYLSSAPPALGRLLLMADVVLIVISLIGLVTIFAAKRGVANSKRTILDLDQQWQRISSVSDAGLPNLIGARAGSSSTSLLLNGLTVLWATILIISIAAPLVLDDRLLMLLWTWTS